MEVDGHALGISGQVGVYRTVSVTVTVTATGVLTYQQRRSLETHKRRQSWMKEYMREYRAKGKRGKAE